LTRRCSVSSCSKVSRPSCTSVIGDFGARTLDKLYER
jgi:hypothetical protein